VTASDRDAVRDVRQGNRDAFGRIVRQYQSRLFGLVMMMVRDRAGAEEVTQDAFVRAFTHLAHYDDQRPFYPWIASIAVRLAQNWLVVRGRAVRREGTALENAPEPASSDGPLTELEAGERSRELWNAVADLSSGERTAVILFYRDELAIADVARALGVTAGTIKTLLFRARRRLRERLGASFTSPKEVLR
jgi:RNA polymerase sigma-70 factor (ECF subfamily)